jgi:Lipocalin-like domain
MRGSMIKTVTLAALVLQVAAWPSAGTLAQSTTDLVGTWTLASSVAEKNGTRTEQFGPGAKGMLSLDGGGHFMLTIIGPDLPKFASNNRAGGTPEENKAVIGKSIAMIGTYSVNPSDNMLTFKVESATFPNWNATEQRRKLVTVNRDEFKYITPTASSGGIGTVTWKRAQ